jgi:hypothetical protein
MRVPADNPSMEQPEQHESPTTITDEVSARAFVQWCIGELGFGYHPDTPFCEYVNDDGTRCFTDEQAAHLDALNGAAFDFCDPYEVGLAEFHRINQGDGPHGTAP